MGIVLISSILITLFSFSFFQADLDNKSKDAILKEIIFQGLLERAHFNQLNLDDDVSKKAFVAYMEKLDPGKRLFIKDDVKRLSAYDDKIDDDIKGANNELLQMSITTWKERVAEAKSYTEEILAQPFDFSDVESVELDADKREYATNKKQLKKEWEKYLEYLALVRYHNKLKSEEKKAEKAKENSEEYT